MLRIFNKESQMRLRPAVLLFIRNTSGADVLDRGRGRGDLAGGGLLQAAMAVLDQRHPSVCHLRPVWVTHTACTTGPPNTTAVQMRGIAAARRSAH